MPVATKVAVFDELAKAVRGHLMAKKHTSVSGLFESINVSDSKKLEILRGYNKDPQLSSIGKKDCALAADLLLDLMRHKKEKIIERMSHVVADYKDRYQKNYTLEIFKGRVKIGTEYQRMVGELFRLIAESRTLGLTTNLQDAVKNLAEALLHESQMAKGYSGELQKVVQFLLQQLTEKPSDTSVSNPSEQPDKESQELSLHLQARLDDAKRIEIAMHLKEKIEEAVKKARKSK